VPADLTRFDSTRATPVLHGADGDAEDGGDFLDGEEDVIR
jgi:hypothetical protein